MSQESQPLAADARELAGKKARRLHAEGLVPAALYGYGVEPAKIQVSAREFEAAYKAAGRTTLVDLKVGDARPVKVFVQEVQRHPVSMRLRHVDFHAVNLLLNVDAEVPVVLVGESPAVHNNEGVLLRGLETVTVHALPEDLPHQVEVSIEGLTEIDQAIHVSDFTVGESYQITTAPDEMIAKIVRQQLDAAAEDAAEAAAATDAAPEDEAAEPAA